MKELQLKYGCNPNQKPSRIYMADGSELPIKVLSGKPGYINFLDAFKRLAACKRAERGNGASGSYFFQTRFTGGGGSGTSSY